MIVADDRSNKCLGGRLGTPGFPESGIDPACSAVLASFTGYYRLEGAGSLRLGGGSAVAR